MQLPFEHESLLLDQDEDQLTETEKMEAIKGDLLFVVWVQASLCMPVCVHVYLCMCAHLC